jgi:hypothetical protein
MGICLMGICANREAATNGASYEIEPQMRRLRYGIQSAAASVSKYNYNRISGGNIVYRSTAPTSVLGMYLPAPPATYSRPTEI